MNNFNVVTSENDLKDRSAIARAFKDNPASFLDECQARKISLNHLLEEKSEDPGNGVPAIFEVAARLDLYAKGSGDKPSSTIYDFFSTKHGMNIFWSILDHDYNRVLGIDKIEKQQFESIGSEADLTPGSSFAPRDQLPLENKLRFSPRFRISDLTPRVQTVSDLFYEQAEFQGPTDGDEYVMKPVAPNTAIPTTTTIVGTRAGSLQKIGAGIKIDDNITGNGMFMEAVRMHVEQIALRTENAIVNNAVKILFDSLGSGTTNFTSLGANPDLSAVIDVNLETGTGNAYMYDLILMRRDEAKEWIEANIQNGNNYIFGGLPPGRFEEVFNSIRVVNNVSGPTRLAFVGNNEIEGWDGSQKRFMAIDPRFCLVYVRRGRGMRDDSDTDIETQTRRRFLTQFFDWWLVNPSARIGWRLS